MIVGEQDLDGRLPADAAACIGKAHFNQKDQAGGKNASFVETCSYGESGNTGHPKPGGGGKSLNGLFLCHNNGSGTDETKAGHYLGRYGRYPRDNAVPGKYNVR